MNDVEITLRILTATFLGFIMGFQRTKHHKPAGIRTHSLVAMGSTLITIVGAYGFANLTDMRDPMRLAAQIVSGVGFIGAGIIFKQRATLIRGITTAASIWVSAGIGIACGAGMYFPAVFVSVLVIVVYRLHSLLISLEIIEPDHPDDQHKSSNFEKVKRSV